MATIMEEDLAELRARGAPVAVVEAAVLIDAGWGYLADETWVVIASPQVTKQRLVDGKGMSDDHAKARIHAQLSNEELKWYADVVIENDGSVADLQGRVDEQWNELQRRIARRAGS